MVSALAQPPFVGRGDGKGQKCPPQNLTFCEMAFPIHPDEKTPDSRIGGPHGKGMATRVSSH